jgi:hypothetical protein
MPPYAVARSDVTVNGFESFVVVIKQFERVDGVKNPALKFVGLLKPLPGLSDRGNEHALVSVRGIEGACEIVADGVEGTRRGGTDIGSGTS